MDKKSIVRRGISEEELDRFLDLFPERSRDKAIELMLNKHVVSIQLIIAAKENTDDYYRSRMIVKDARDHLGVDSLGFGQKVAYFNEEGKAFILSVISRCFSAFKLIFSSSRMSVFVTGIDNMSATIVAPYVSKDHLLITLWSNGSNIALFDLSQNNAEVSDDIWNVILNNYDNVNYMISAYVHEKYYFSDNIKKRIQALYESLSDSDKLLFELGEGSTNAGKKGAE